MLLLRQKEIIIGKQMYYQVCDSIYCIPKDFIGRNVVILDIVIIHYTNIKLSLN